MATEPAKKEPAANVQPIKPKKKGKLLWIVIAVVVIGGGAGQTRDVARSSDLLQV